MNNPQDAPLYPCKGLPLIVELVLKRGDVTTYQGCVKTSPSTSVYTAVCKTLEAADEEADKMIEKMRGEK